MYRILQNEYPLIWLTANTSWISTAWNAWSCNHQPNDLLMRSYLYPDQHKINNMVNRQRRTTATAAHGPRWLGFWCSPEVGIGEEDMIAGIDKLPLVGRPSVPGNVAELRWYLDRSTVEGMIKWLWVKICSPMFDLNHIQMAWFPCPWQLGWAYTASHQITIVTLCG